MIPDYSNPRITPSRSNLELKAFLDNEALAVRIALETLNARDEGSQVQTDTYFAVPRGRLKLREVTGMGDHAALIYYERPDVEPVRVSRFEYVPVSNAVEIRRLLSLALSVRGTVTKRRHILLWDNCRIHLDNVESLGAFIEFEVCSEGDEADDERRMRILRKAFQVTNVETIGGSYSDMLGL
jgi:adenylate cyclase class IV